MIRQLLDAVSRHAVTFIGGYFAAKGYIEELDQETLLGLSTAVAGLLMSVINKFKQ